MFNPTPKPVKSEKKPKTRIKPVSKVRAKELKTYFQKRKEFLEAHPTCQAKLVGCTGQVNDLHHSAGRSGKQLNNDKMFLALCRSCHYKVHNMMSAAEARKKGLKK